MIRARFKVIIDDYNPITWPIKHPYWCSGSFTPEPEHPMFEDGYVLIAYADSVDDIKENWPEAFDIEYEERDCYTFTDRFPKPEWFQYVR